MAVFNKCYEMSVYVVMIAVDCNVNLMTVVYSAMYGSDSWRTRQVVQFCGVMRPLTVPEARAENSTNATKRLDSRLISHHAWEQ
jgi:hypothetical protein